MSINIAKYKAALQSSYSPFSSPDEALKAINANKTGSFTKKHHGG